MRLPSRVAASSIGTAGRIRSPAGSAEAFGAGVGRAVGALGSAAYSAANAVGAAVDRDLAETERRDREAAANHVAQTNFKQRELDLQEEVPANGDGYAKRAVQEYDDMVNERASELANEEQRRVYRSRMNAKRSALVDRVTIWEEATRREYSKSQANLSLDGLANQIMSDPVGYENHVVDGEEVIKNMEGRTQAQRLSMANAWRQKAVNARFEGLIAGASSVADLDATAEELTQKEWQNQFSATDYASIINSVATARRKFVTSQKAEVRASLDSIEARFGMNATVPDVELNDVMRKAREVGDVSLFTRAAKARLNQNLRRRTKGVTPSDVDAQANYALGAVDATYPSLPPVLSDAAREAQNAFGVSPNVVGGIIVHEYGGLLKPRGRDATNDFQFVDGSSADLTLRQQQMLNDAGFKAGFPLRVSGSGANGVAINLLGLGEDERSKAVGALVDAGFVGFEQDGYTLRVKSRESVSPSYGVHEDGRTWSGFSYLDEDVAKVLAERGFEANKAADQIAREAIKNGGDIDYGRPTQVKGSDGKPATSAVGVGQFLERTWLELNDDPTVAALLGTEGLTDAEKLELRKNPRIATLGVAAYAAKNRAAMERALGRTVQDGEIYMAHFLGASGATALIQANETQPLARADVLFPQAAANNRPVFYDNGRARSVTEVYGRLSRGFAVSPTAGAAAEASILRDIADQKRKALKDDGMKFADSEGVVAIGALDSPEAFEQRAIDAAKSAQYYNVPIADWNPFTNEEAAQFAETMKNGGVNETVATLTNIAHMPGLSGDAALRQLDAQDRVYAYAAGQYKAFGDVGTLRTIVAGQRRLTDNPAFVKSMGVTNEDRHAAFESHVGPALAYIDPSDRQAINDAAFAHYVEVSATSGRTDTFDTSKYKDSIDVVLGSRVGEVNGGKFILPPGIDEDTFQTSMYKMGPADWVAASDVFEAPRYEDGEVVDLQTLKEEATFHAIGGNKYRVHIDGAPVVTNRVLADGRREAFVFHADPKRVTEVASRAYDDIPVGPTGAEAVVGDLQGTGKNVFGQDVPK